MAGRNNAEFENMAKEVQKVLLRCLDNLDFKGHINEYNWFIDQRNLFNALNLAKDKQDILTKYIYNWKIEEANYPSGARQAYVIEHMDKDLNELYILSGNNPDLTYWLHSNHIESVKNLLGIPANLALIKHKLKNKQLEFIREALQRKAFGDNLNATMLGNAICEVQWNYLKALNPKLAEENLVCWWLINPDTHVKLAKISDKNLYKVNFCASFWLDETTDKMEQLFSIKPGELSKKAFWGFTEHTTESIYLVHNFNDFGKYSEILRNPDLSVSRLREKAKNKYDRNNN